jgi:hypothetical protein
MIESDACARLTEMTERLAVADPSPRSLLTRLGREAAGIRAGPAGVVDLARGGRDVLRGRGFNRQFDDGTDGQVRHFVVLAVSTMVFGRRATRCASVKLPRPRGITIRPSGGRGDRRSHSALLVLQSATVQREVWL